MASARSSERSLRASGATASRAASAGPPQRVRTRPVERAVGDDAMQPGRERARAIEAVEHADGLQERLLGDVLGRVRIARDEIGRAVGLPPVAAVELLDGARIAAAARTGRARARCASAAPARAQRCRRRRARPPCRPYGRHRPAGPWRACGDNSPRMEGIAGILLAGGRSQRMGRDKASLPWHGSTLARRAAGLLARVAEPPVIVVCAPEQELPPLPLWVQIVRDPEPGLGPLAGLASGLAAAGPRAEARCGLRRRRSARPSRRAGGAPRRARRRPRRSCRSRTALPQPLFAVYRTELAFLAAALVADGERRAAALGERSGARAVEPFELLVVDDIAAFDPGLASFSSFDDVGCLRRRAGGATAARDGHGRPRGPARAACLDSRPRAAPAARGRCAAASGRRPGRRRDAALRRRRARARLGLRPARAVRPRSA